MAQVLKRIATGLTIAALVRTSFEGYDIVQTSLSQDIDYAKLQLRLKVEKCRLYNWAESMGLLNIAGIDVDGLENCVRFPTAVRSILEDLFQLFQSAERVKDKYTHGYIPIEGNRPFDGKDSTFLNPALRPADSSQITRIKQTVTWLLYDRKHFTLVVAEIKDLIDKLRDITMIPSGLDGLNETDRRTIGKVYDTEALELVSGVCAADHPDIIRLRQRRPVLHYSSRSSDSTEQSYSDTTVWPGTRRARNGMPKL